MNADLVKAIQTMPEPKKDSRNSHFKQGYASLSAVSHCVKDHLLKSGFALTQTFDGHTLVTAVWSEKSLVPELESRIDVDFASGNGPNYWQTVGQGITYLRRYALCAMFCLVAGDVDDDAELQTWFNQEQAREQEATPAESNGTVPNVQNIPTGTPSRVL